MLACVGSSQLDGTVRKLEDLRSKPELLKAELRQFVAALPSDHQIDVKVDKKLFDIMMNLVTYELKKEGSPDLPVIMQAIQVSNGRATRREGRRPAHVRCASTCAVEPSGTRGKASAWMCAHLCPWNGMCMCMCCFCCRRWW